MGLASRCALPGDRISYSSSVCVCLWGGVYLCLGGGGVFVHVCLWGDMYLHASVYGGVYLCVSV